MVVTKTIAPPGQEGWLRRSRRRGGCSGSKTLLLVIEQPPRRFAPPLLSRRGDRGGFWLVSFRYFLVLSVITDFAVCSPHPASNPSFAEDFRVPPESCSSSVRPYDRWTSASLDVRHQTQIRRIVSDRARAVR